MTDEIELLQSERVERLQQCKSHVVDAPPVGQIAGAIDPRQRDGDHSSMFRQSFVKSLQLADGAMHVGKAVQIDERLARASFQHGDFAPVRFDDTRAHLTASGIFSLR